MQNQNEISAAGPRWDVVRHTLDFPVDGPNGRVTEVTLREPDVEALEKLDDLGLKEGSPLKIGHIRAMIATLSGLPDEVVRQMHRRDFTALAEKLVPLFVPPEAEEA